MKVIKIYVINAQFLEGALHTEAFAFSALPSTDESGVKPNLLAMKISERFPVRLNLRSPA